MVASAGMDLGSVQEVKKDEGSSLGGRAGQGLRMAAKDTGQYEALALLGGWREHSHWEAEALKGPSGLHGMGRFACAFCSYLIITTEFPFMRS